MNFYRGTLTPNEEQVIPHNSQKVTIFNFGPSDVHINFGATADANSLIIPKGFGRTVAFSHIVKSVHVFAAEETTVQIDGMG
ncbi:hypothetical protein SporoP37_01885 [Sporosarcina sp. P37]|uniref:hypothetical protein n=1 Tax=unclassified Sporosarcina TaxID=2647733 RepID=UPI000A17BFF1|nr:MULTISPECIES: hypothetical protein [unclassified Sporosarcina]ARK23565.1 hypothetical protein SporoP37_01885 [Sporosarcina sp. P37]PID18812.1 hypothetical protein CSV62_06865 [Sporosarcina sp. P35]